MIWQTIGILLVLLAVNLLLWIFAMPRYVNRRILRFQNELVNRHYDDHVPQNAGLAARLSQSYTDTEGLYEPDAV